MMGERQVRKRAVNLFVETELLDEARRLRINLSETLERRLRSIVRSEQEKRWLEANQAAIAAYNARVSRDGYCRTTRACCERAQAIRYPRQSIPAQPRPATLPRLPAERPAGAQPRQGRTGKALAGRERGGDLVDQ